MIKNRFFAVIGYGNSGRATADFLKKNGARVAIWDDNGDYKITDEDWNKIDTVVVSPGIHLRWPEIHKCVKIAHERLIPIITDMDIFQRVSTGKNICITGTNGKSTTTALTYHILNKYYKTTIGGNFGPAILSLDKKSDFNVLELSSYQLEGCNLCGFDVSVLLNITSDHLTRHGGMTGYIATKQKIFSNFTDNSYGIISVDDEYCREIYNYMKNIHPHMIPISGQSISDGIGWTDDFLTDYGVRVCKNNPVMEGVHNRQNISATYAICKSIGLSKESFIDGLMSFKNLEHRQELVRTINNVPYVNDSKATNCDAVEQALKRYNQIIWILGGLPKEEGIETLTRYFDKIDYALLIGDVAEKWSNLLTQYNIKNEISGTLDVAVKRAYEISLREVSEGKNPTVLLSPACASFDQFKSFEDRGDKFKKFVLEL